MRALVFISMELFVLAAAALVDDSSSRPLGASGSLNMFS
jgi:hypothetical protein